LVFFHRVRKKKGNILAATGKTVVVCVKNGKLLIKLPEWVENKILDFINNVQGGNAW